MMVARQFIAWYASQDRIRPVGNGLILRRPGLPPPKAKGRIQPTDHTVPYGTVPFSNVSQAVNCLATIIQSLRDKKPNL